MKIVMTGPYGMLAFWSNKVPESVHQPILSPDGEFSDEIALGFARLSAFAANWNSKPRQLRVVSDRS